MVSYYVLYDNGELVMYKDWELAIRDALYTGGVVLSYRDNGHWTYRIVQKGRVVAYDNGSRYLESRLPDSEFWSVLPVH